MYIVERGPLAETIVYPLPVLRSINNVRGTQCFGLWSFLSTVVAGCCLYAALHYSPDTAVRLPLEKPSHLRRIAT
jgi:hypothetical protein